MSDNDKLNREINNYVPPTPSPKKCPGCKGKGWQKRNDGIKVTCPMCGGTGVFMPTGTITFRTVPVYIQPPTIHVHPPCVVDPPKPSWKEPWPGYPQPYVGDDPRDWYGPPKTTC